MDRYFYSVEMYDNHKLVHISGNVYENDSDENETCFRYAEWTGMYMTIEEIMTLCREFDFYDYINERINYLVDIAEEEAINICKEYFNGNSGDMLHITRVNEDTPCGDYWFE